MRITLRSTACRLTARKGTIRFFESGRIAASVRSSTCGFRLGWLKEIEWEVPNLFPSIFFTPSYILNVNLLARLGSKYTFTLSFITWNVYEESSGISISPFKSWVSDTGSEKEICIPFSGCSIRWADMKRKMFLAGIVIFSTIFRSMPAAFPSSLISSS